VPKLQEPILGPEEEGRCESMKTTTFQYEVKNGKLFASVFREGVGGKGYICPIKKEE